MTDATSASAAACLLEHAPLPPAPRHPVRLGMVGCGYIAHEAYFPAIAFLQAAGWPIELAAVADRQPERLAAARSACPSAATHGDATALLDAGGCDAVLALLWPPDLANLAEAAVSRELAVLVEKPLADRAREIAALRERIGARADRVQVAYNRPHQPLAAAWRERIGAAWDDPGSSLEVRLWRVRRTEPGFLHDVVVHPVSLLRAQAGELAVRRATRGPMAGAHGLPAWLRVDLSSASGLPITLDVRPAVGRCLETYDFHGAARSWRLDYLAQTRVSDSAGLAVWHEGRRETIFTHNIEGPIADAALVRGFVHQLAHFVRLAAGEVPRPVCSLADAQALLVTWEAIDAASRGADV